MTLKNCLFFSAFLTVTSIFGFQKIAENNAIILLTKEKTYSAGANIVLQFKNIQTTNTFLYCTNSYGTTLVKPETINNIQHFSLPKIMVNKAGVVRWKLMSEKNISTGNIIIEPQEKAAVIESYLGTTSLESDKKNYNVITVLPTDVLDNVVKENTKITFKTQFLNTTKAVEKAIKNGMAYYKIYSSDKTGKMFINSEILEINSKEYTLDIVPTVPTNFTISANRGHNFADGNQITTFTTSTIKDKFGSIVTNGTFITFSVTDANGFKSKTYGSTVNGIATAKMLNPSKAQQWTVKAFIKEIATSNTIKLDYKQAITGLEVAFLDTNRTLKVGPFKSFMSQIVPDGVRVKLFVYQNNKRIEEFTQYTNKGYCSFTLINDRFPEGTYNLKFEAAGMEKEYKNIRYENLK